MHGLAAQRGRSGGFVLVAFSLALLLILGAAGLTFDIGRMYITRGEARAFCDAAAIAAALKLDGTPDGFTAAQAAAMNTVKGWQFGTKRFDASSATINVAFGKITGSHCDFTLPPTVATAPEYICARVSVKDVNLPMFLMPALTHVFSSNIGAQATAAQIQLPGPGAGNFSPFSPFAHPRLDPVPPNPVPAGDAGDPFNLKAGVQYSLLWPNTNQLDITDPDKVCAGDADLGWVAVKSMSGSDNRGYLYNQASVVDATILTNVMPTGYNPINTLDLIGNGYYLNSAGAMHENIIGSLADRVMQDSDPDSTTWAEYDSGGRGNGKRVIVVPINAGPCTTLSYQENGGQNPGSYTGVNTCEIPSVTPHPVYQSYQVIGWGQFFLLNASYYQDQHGNENACAVYIGPGSVQGGGGTGGNPNAFTVKLVE